MAAVFGAAGLNRFAVDPWVNIMLATLFLLFAANLFGWLELRIPWIVLNAVDRSGRQAPEGSSGPPSSWSDVSPLTSVTCTAPLSVRCLVLASPGIGQCRSRE